MTRIKSSDVMCLLMRKIRTCGLSLGGISPLRRTLSFLILGAVMAVPVLAFSGAARYATPMWSMGNFNPHDPTNITAVTTSPRLAFKGMSLAELSAKIDDGYTIFAEMIGNYTGPTLRGKLASFYNRRNYPASGTPEKIFGDFCIFDNTSPGYLKAVCVEFTGGEDGVYVKALQSLYKATATIDQQNTDFMVVSTEGMVTYKNYTGLAAISTQWENGNYGVATLQLAKFVGAGSSALVWPEVTVDDIKEYTIAGMMGGRSAGKGIPCTAYNRHIVKDGGVTTAMTVEMQGASGDTVSCVVLRLTNGDGGVYAEVVTARSVSGETLGYIFSNGDGTYQGDAEAIATDYENDGYGIYGLVARQKAFDKEVSTIFPTSSPTLVWENVTLDDIKDRYLGCRFTGAWVATGTEGIGRNRRLDYNGGMLNAIRIEFQVRDSSWLKCVVAEFTNGTGGVYVQPLKACALNNAEAGHQFINDNGTYNNPGTLATSRTGNGYALYHLFAVPNIVLDSDEDWSPCGRIELGDAVIDLNGHNLTAGELVFDTSRTGMVINTQCATTAQMRFYTFEGGCVSNNNVSVGSSGLDADNIRLAVDGRGVYYAAKPQEYLGGTEIAGGVLKPIKTPGGATTTMLGATSGVIKVNKGGTFNWNATWDFLAYPVFVLNGGTIENGATVVSPETKGYLKGISLEADSSLSAENSWGLINLAFSEFPLSLGGHKLDVTVSGGKILYFMNVRVLDTGVINIGGTGVLEVNDASDYGKTDGFGFMGPLVDIRVATEIRLKGPMSVHDYEAAATKNGSNIGTGLLAVNGTFKPTTQYFRGVTMQNGSTMDFSEWPLDAGWPVVTAYTCAGEKNIRFAEDDNVTVTVRLGDRYVSTSTPIVAWNDDNRPDFSKVNFSRHDSDSNYMLVKKNDGLYVSHGLMIIIR